MKVAKDLVVSTAYQVRTEDGVLVDESPVSAPLDYLHGHGSLIAGLEKALEGHDVGDRFDVHVGANDAYGNYDENPCSAYRKTSSWALTNCRSACVSWLTPIRARYRLKSPKLTATTWWLTATTCWPAKT